MKFKALMVAALAAFGLVAGAAQGSPAMRPLSIYGNLPGVEDMSVAPDGKHVAAIATIKGTRQVVITDEKQRLVTSAPIGESKLRGLWWVSPRILLVRVTATENLGPGFTADMIELGGVIRVSLDGEKPEMVFGNSSAMVRATFGYYGTRVVDGKVFGYFGGVELARSQRGTGYEFEHGRPSLMEVDLGSMRSRRLAPAPPAGTDRDWLVDRAGKVAATLDVRTGGNWKISSPNGGTIATGNHPGGKVGLVALGKDGTSLIYSLEDLSDGQHRWYEVPVSGGPATEFLADIDVERLFVDPATGHLLGYLPQGKSPKPVLFDAVRQNQLARVYRAFPKVIVSVSEWAPDFSRFLVRTTGNGDSGTWYTIDMTAKRADPIGYDYPALDSDAVGLISTVAYRASDGLELDGILTLPPGRPAKGLPAVMLPHGGPHSHDEASFDWWAQALASRGYAVFQPNFRGSTNRDENFKRAGYGQWGRKMQTDISDGLGELVRQGIVDPKRVCIVGASYGGYAALAGVTLQKGLYRCAVSVAGVSDLGDMYWTDYRESGESKMLKRNLTEQLGSPSAFAEVSPRKHARGADAPILLIHGKDDTVVPYKQSTAMESALKSANKPVEFVVLREEDHWLSRSATRLQMLEATVAFVTKHNPPD